MAVSPILVSFHLGQCSTSMTMGERVESTIIHPYNQATDLTSNHLNHVFLSCILARLFCCCCGFFYKNEPSLQPNFNKSPTIMCVRFCFKSKPNNSYTVIPKSIKKYNNILSKLSPRKVISNQPENKIITETHPKKIPPWTRSFQRLEERL